MRLAIIGQQDFGKAALEAFVARGDEVAGVFCAPVKPGAKPDALREAADERGLPVFAFASLRSAEAKEALRKLNVDVGVMAYVLQFAPQDFVNIPRCGTIQFHPSLLPLHRGPSSINWPVALGRKETGITIFRPTDGLDEGPVILQKTCEIGADESVGELYFNKLFPLGIQALLEAADLVVAGRHQELVQDESQATYEGWFDEDAARIDWSRHVDQVYDLIRAGNPAPGAWTMLAGQRVAIFDARKHPVRRYGEMHKGKPGDVASVNDSSIFINANGGQIEALRVRPQGGKKVGAGEFARAVRLSPSSS